MNSPHDLSILSLISNASLLVQIVMLILVLISGAKKRDVVEKGNGLPVHALLKQAKAPVRVLWTP